MYAPTFRKKDKTKWFPFNDLDIDKLAIFLEKNNAILALRAHPNEKMALDEYQKISSRFVNASHERIENINTLLNLSDVILTDYSSVYIEGLLKDIPSIFIPYDMDTYERGLPLSYDQVTPGPKVNTQFQLLKSLKDALEDPCAFSGEREFVKNLFFSNCDGKSTNRMVRFLEEQS